MFAFSTRRFLTPHYLQDMWDELVEVIKKGDPQWEPNPEVRGAFFQYTDDDEQNRREVALIGPFDPELNTITGSLDLVPSGLPCALNVLNRSLSPSGDWHPADMQGRPD